MNRLELDFVPHWRLGSPIGLVIFVAGAVVAAGIAFDYLEARDALTRAEARHARLEREAKPLPRTGQAGKGQVAQPSGSAPENSKAVAVALTQLHLPWEVLLRELESRVSPSVALLSIEAQGQGQTLRLSAETKNMSDAVSYIDSLRKSTAITSATLSSHEEKQAGPAKVIRFNVDVKWRKTS